MLTYNNFKKKLENRYVVVPEEDAKLYFDENNKLAAYEKDNAITTWHQCDKQVVWNHHDCVAVTLVKGMDLPSKKSYKGYARYDALYVFGLCGATTYVERYGTYAVDTKSNHSIELEPDYSYTRKSSFGNDFEKTDSSESTEQKRSSKTYTTCDGEDISVTYQEDFDRLTYDQKISFLEDCTGAHFSGAEIDGIRVLPSNYVHDIVYFGKVSRWGDSFHVENDIFQMNIPALPGIRESYGCSSMIPVVKLKKYGNILPPDVEITIDRWGGTDKVYTSMVNSVCLGEKADVYQKSKTFRGR